MIRLIKSKIFLLFIFLSTSSYYGQELFFDIIDINPGPGPSTPAAFDPNGSFPLIFGVYHPTLGNLLYSTDGTNEGTTQFIDPPITDGGTGFAFETSLQAEYFNNNFYEVHGEVGFVFAQLQLEEDVLIYKTTGYRTDNVNKTKTEFDLPGGDVEPFGATKIFGSEGIVFWFSKTTEQNQTNHWVLFSYGLNIDDRELWRTDGTTEGTVIVKDINEGQSASSFPDELTIVLEDPSDPIENNDLPISAAVFFSAEESIHGRELWVTDGTEQKTYMIKDIYEGESGSYPSSLTAMGNKLYFAANDVSYGRELWVSDGTEAGTKRIKDIAPEWMNSGPSEITLINDMLYFQANDGINGTELWTSDGTEEGTVLLKDILPIGDSYPRSFTKYNNKIYFTATGEDGRELWVTDNTSEGTVLVKDIYPGEQSSNPSSFTLFDDKLYFFAENETNGRELWRTDGTDEGTELVFDIYPGATSSLQPWTRMIIVENKIFFAADDGVHGEELVVITHGINVDVGDLQNNLAHKFTLDQNYPNPFNPTTTIRYSIPNVASGFSLSNVQLKLYDVLGRELKTLVNKNQSPGNYEIIFNASNFPSGVYYYQLKSGDYLETKKMSLLK